MLSESAPLSTARNCLVQLVGRRRKTVYNPDGVGLAEHVCSRLMKSWLDHNAGVVTTLVLNRRETRGYLVAVKLKDAPVLPFAQSIAAGWLAGPTSNDGTWVR